MNLPCFPTQALSFLSAISVLRAGCH
jgi:hypothetical protein